ncbi:MAG: glycosyltransferase [Nitrospirae bacterium]|nr:MAG: glycosyltransferase [Nitrospirota bacterium]
MNRGFFKLVITVALDAEIDKEWFIKRGVPVYRLKALMAGALAGSDKKRCGILVVITGVGTENSERAARWISENLSPLFVLNLGTACSPGGSPEVGNWVIPERISTPDGESIITPSYNFIPSMDGMKKTPLLITIPHPLKGEIRTKSETIFDMEAFYQARQFAASGIPFHSVKFITDLGKENAEAQYQRHLPVFREKTRRLFSFLDNAPSPSDISVVIPVYNRRDMVVRAVNSVLSQIEPPLEVIVVDDGSTDGTQEALEGFLPGIRMIRLKSNSGPSVARNRGVREAGGRWIGFLDSDDEWYPEKLKLQRDYLKRYPFFEILQSEEVWFRNGKRVNPCRHHLKKEGWIWKDSLNLCLISPSSVLLKKSLFERYGGFREDLPACEDYDLWLKITRYHPVGLVPTYCGARHAGGHEQQSKRFPAMDRFRVESLFTALERETDPELAEEIKTVLKKKASILIKGFRKRGKDTETAELEERLKRYGCYIT